MKKAVIIGATSGIGKGLARIMSGEGYVVGLAGRRTELLTEIKNELPGEAYFRWMDLSRPTEAVGILEDLIGEMGGMDMIVISSGVCYDNPGLDWEKEKSTIDVNVAGFTSLAGAAFDYFRKKGSGHIIGISSIRGLRGGWSAPAYNASKAGLTTYLEALRNRLTRRGVNVLTVKPGNMKTQMLEGVKHPIFPVTPEEAADATYRAMKSRKQQIYIGWIWKWIMLIVRNIPSVVFRRMSF